MPSSALQRDRLVQHDGGRCALQTNFLPRRRRRRRRSVGGWGRREWPAASQPWGAVDPTSSRPSGVEDSMQPRRPRRTSAQVMIARGDRCRWSARHALAPATTTTTMMLARQSIHQQASQLPGERAWRGRPPSTTRNSTGFVSPSFTAETRPAELHQLHSHQR